MATKKKVSDRVSVAQAVLRKTALREFRRLKAAAALRNNAVLVTLCEMVISELSGNDEDVCRALVHADHCVEDFMLYLATFYPTLPNNYEEN